MRVLTRVVRTLVVAALGFVLGAGAIYITMLRGGPPLELWHTIWLENEFTLGQSEQIRTLDEYLALEATLFRAVDERIYDVTPTGPDQALARYSRGSDVDPSRFERDWNRTFELPADAPRGGVLLLHGMTDAPYSLRTLGLALNERGYQVVGLRLPGHGTLPSGLTTVTWEDMAAATSIAARHLRDEAGADSLHVIGYSTGAALAVHHALEALDDPETPDVASLVLVSPAIAISAAAAGASWLRMLSNLPGLGKLAWTQIVPEFDPFKYNSFAVNAGDQVHRLTRDLVRDLDRRTAQGAIRGFPSTLAFLSTVDATVRAEAVIDNLLEHLAPEGHELVLFDINRSEVKSTVLVSDPGPLTKALIGNEGLPFHLSIIGNESPTSDRIVSRRKPPFSTAVSTRSLDRRWPTGAISLSHVALPFAPDDPLYGVRTSEFDETLHLGDMAFRGERGLLKFPADWLMRLRHNPFYDDLESRTLDWVAESEAPR